MNPRFVPQVSLRYLLLFTAALACGTGQSAEQKRVITDGPMLGRVSAHGIGIWGRTRAPGAIAVRYGRAPDRMTEMSDSAETRLEHDNTAWVQLRGLESNTTYYYELIFPDMTPDGGTGRTGFFHTLPDAAKWADAETNPEGLFNFAFEFGCGNNQKYYNTNGPGLPAFKTMLDTLPGKVDFAILNGDWLYEYDREYTVPQWRSQVGASEEDTPEILKIAPTLAGVWENYKYFLEAGPNMAQWHRLVPTYYTYDDHEILNDVYGTGSAGLRDRRAAFRDIGTQAWYDYLAWSNPVPYTQPIHFGKAMLKQGGDVLVNPDADFTRLDFEQMTNLMVHWGGPTAGVNDNALDFVGGDPNAGVYDVVEVLDAHRLRIAPPARANGEAAYSIGRRSYFHMQVSNCDFFFLDTRGQRGLHDIKDPFKKGLSMLGADQRDWLIDGVKKSDGDFIFIISSVNFTIPHVGGSHIRDQSNKDEAWTVFLEERERLIELWDAQEKPVFVLTGDLHNSFAIQITDNVWEFASGPHNSDNHRAADEGNRPPNGPFTWGPREVNIRWSTYFLPESPRERLRYPHYCVVKINNVLENPTADGGKRWIAFPQPQVIFQYFNGRTGDLVYAESILAAGP